MATHLVVDGYNFIGHEGGLRGDLRTQRERLVRRLADYRRQRGHHLTVVFDGWGSGWSSEHRDWIDGVEVIYSREGEQADEVIARVAEAEGAAVVAVSSDRAVQLSVRRAGGVALTCSEFERKVRESARAESAALQEKDVEEEEPGPHVKRGNPRRRPKADRRKAVKLRKL